MRRGIVCCWLLAAVLLAPCAQAAQPASSPPLYGSNPAAAGTFVHDGVKLYFEVYGQGPPLLLIHGNGGSIASMKNQIEHFRHQYRVITMDSRDHGQSDDAPGPLTFEAMADDLAALLEHLHATPARVLGWSDGGIEALLLGLRHPTKVSRIAAMAANLRPDGVVPELFAEMNRPRAPTPAHAPTRSERVEALDRDEPHISPDTLKSLTVPTLILASDHDLIAAEHTLEIYQHIPNAQLAIFPDATHMIPLEDPTRFNATVDRFLSQPVTRH